MMTAMAIKVTELPFARFESEDIFSKTGWPVHDSASLAAVWLSQRGENVVTQGSPRRPLWSCLLSAAGSHRAEAAAMQRWRGTRKATTCLIGPKH